MLPIGRPLEPHTRVLETSHQPALQRRPPPAGARPDHQVVTLDMAFDLSAVSGGHDALSVRREAAKGLTPAERSNHPMASEEGRWLSQ